LKRVLTMVLVLAVVLSLLTGCSTEKNGEEPQGVDDGTSTTVTLYFADRQAQYLVPVQEEVSRGDELDLMEAAVLALLEGPADSSLSRTIPEGTRLLELRVEEGTVYIDLSSEVVEEHWGGSAGEIMTIYSIVNTLTEFKGVEQVQILVEGQELLSLTGHLDISHPIERNEELIKR